MRSGGGLRLRASEFAIAPPKAKITSSFAMAPSCARIVKKL
jgi:hypothetical protein